MQIVFSRKYGPAIQSSVGKTKDVISSMLYKSKLPQKGLQPQVNNERGLSNDQTEIVKKHPASWSPIDCWEKKISGKNAICLNWWFNSYDDTGLHRLQLRNLPLRHREDEDPSLKILPVAKLKRIKDKPIICFHFKRSFLDSEHTAFHMTVLRCFQPGAPSINLWYKKLHGEILTAS